MRGITVGIGLQGEDLERYERIREWRLKHGPGRMLDADWVELEDVVPHTGWTAAQYLDQGKRKRAARLAQAQEQ